MVYRRMESQQERHNSLQSYYNKIKAKVNVQFEKVKGHSGDKYNDMADMLAKKACGVL